MRRREFITFLGGATALPLAARAQQPERPRRIGLLLSFGESDPEGQSRVIAFRQQLEKLGWSVGRAVQIEYRWVSEPKRARINAAELAALKPETILVYGPPNLAALLDVTRTTPIVFVQVTGPVELGFVASLARPAGNVTGFTNFEYSIGGKWLEILKEVVPTVTRVMAISSPTSPGAPYFLREIEAGAQKLGVQLMLRPAMEAKDFSDAIEAFARESNGGVIVLPDNSTFAHRDLIVALTSQYRLPAIYPLRLFATRGGLISYGVDQIDQSRRAASYVDRILKGEKPADLPVQAPTKFELVVNNKTAKAIGLSIAESFLLRADEVIE